MRWAPTFADCWGSAQAFTGQIGDPGLEWAELTATEDWSSGGCCAGGQDTGILELTVIGIRVRLGFRLLQITRMRRFWGKHLPPDNVNVVGRRYCRNSEMWGAGPAGCSQVLSGSSAGVVRPLVGAILELEVISLDNF